jgi:hypothetical protein
VWVEVWSSFEQGIYLRRRKVADARLKNSRG